MKKRIIQLILALLLSANCLPLAAQPCGLDTKIEELRTDPEARAAAQESIEKIRAGFKDGVLGLLGTLMYSAEQCNIYIEGEPKFLAFISAIAKDPTEESAFLSIYGRAKSGEATVAGQFDLRERIKYEYGIRACNRSFVDIIEAVDFDKILQVIDYQEKQRVAEALKSLESE